MSASCRRDSDNSATSARAFNNRTQMGLLLSVQAIPANKAGYLMAGTSLTEKKAARNYFRAQRVVSG